ncbi:MAG: hypothetical protein IKV35_07100, partial [Clostridia bacterium]|nr:hypothetical protein [Clostridia bacterium]
GVVFLIGELGDSGSTKRRGGDDDDDETVTTTTAVAEYPELNHPKTAEEAVDSFFAVHYDMSEETILFAMPDEMAAYYEETYGIKVDDEFLAEARNQSASDPSKRVTAEYGELTRVATATGVDRVPLAEMGIVMDDVVWYKQQAAITHSDGDVTQNDYYVMYYHGHYYSFSAIGFLNTTAKAVAANREKATCGECGVEGKIGEDIIFYNDVGEALCEDCYEDWQQSQQAAAIIGTWGCYIDGELMFGETCKGEKVWMTMTYKENGMYQQRFDPEDLLRCSAKANGYYTVDAYLSVAGVTYDEAVSKMDELNPSDLAYTFDGKKLVMNGYNETFTLNGDTLTLYESTTFVMTRQ